ncbi:hypothetical protein HDU96_007724 [Phlyctochytrium bullatum]|nr:hypothetical protein HDU96_007724 [Phlyctochytrium bullatum]
MAKPGKGKGGRDKAASASKQKPKAPETPKLIMTVSPVWHEGLPEIPSGARKQLSEEEQQQMYERAKTLIETEEQIYKQQKQKSKADVEFLSTVLKSGTTNDKISALTLMVQESPLHNINLLRDQLLHGIAKKKARRDALLAVDAIRDLMVGGVLPDRKLRFFRDNPLGVKGLTDKHLMAWHFEDALKRFYFEFLQVIEDLLRDPLPFVRSKALNYVSELLSSKPEQEANLLLMLVNKFGDIEKKIASKAAYLLSNVLTKHPAMSLVVIKEVERFLFRPGVHDRAKYVALNFLNQLVLSNNEDDRVCAQQLVKIYINLFESLTAAKGKPQHHKSPKNTPEKPSSKGSNEKAQTKTTVNQSEKTASSSSEGTLNSSLIGGILTGINRAFPYAKLPEDVATKHLDTVYRISHEGSFYVCIQALNLVFQVEMSKDFYAPYLRLRDLRKKPSATKSKGSKDEDEVDDDDLSEEEISRAIFGSGAGSGEEDEYDDEEFDMDGMGSDLEDDIEADDAGDLDIDEDVSNEDEALDDLAVQSSDEENDAGQDVDEDDEDIEIDDESDGNASPAETTSKTKKRRLNQLATSAERLGYKGDYFKNKASGLAFGDFASADDFAELIEKEEDETEVSSQASRPGKRRSNGKAKFSKKQRVVY